MRGHGSNCVRENASFRLLTQCRTFAVYKNIREFYGKPYDECMKLADNLQLKSIVKQ